MASSLLNITGSRVNDDPSFRYTMPKLDIVYEGRGNGCKTVILNLPKVCDALDVCTEFPVKFFSYELSTQVKYNAELERCIINGTHSAESLQTVLNAFIDQYVLCPVCTLPEIVLSVKKEALRYKCKSCGAKSDIRSAHKLSSFIVQYVKREVQKCKQ